MGLKISKLVGLPQVMECPHCKTPMEPKRTLKAKLWAAAGGAAAVALVPIPAAAAVVGAEVAREYLYDKKGIYYKCLACGYEYSQAKTEKEVEETVRQVLEAEGIQRPKEYEEQKRKDEQALDAGRSQRLIEEDQRKKK